MKSFHTQDQLAEADISRRTGKAVCPYCGVGCVVSATVADNKIEAIGADKRQQPNFGVLCPKGAYLSKVFVDGARVTHPMIRDRRDGEFRQASWNEALSLISYNLNKIRFQHGKDALAFYGSGQLDTEASYCFVKLFKGFIGTNNMDTNSRLCMSSAAAAYTRTLGADGPPTCYDDINHADVFLIVGANMASNHPVLFKKIRKRRAASPQCRIIVVDPRRTKTAAAADIHVQAAPGSDVALFQLLAKKLLERGVSDTQFIQQHTEQFGEYAAHLHSLDEQMLQTTCDISSQCLDEIVELLSDRTLNLLSFYCMGTNQSTQGVDKNESIINLHLQLGQICRPGAGPFSLTGQPNAMGGREVGYLSHQLPGYRLVANEHHRQCIEQYWQLPPGSIDSRPGLTAVPMFDAAARGEIKALWIASTNPAVSMPNASLVQAALQTAEFVIVQDCYTTGETIRYADVLLPAAQWGEKVGTMTNSERLVVRSEKFLSPPGEAQPDWQIVCAVARSMGFNGFDFHRAEAVWREYRHLTAGTACDQSGMATKRLRQAPLQWPCPNDQHPGTARLYADKRFAHADGKARFQTSQYRSPAETPDEEYPLVLTTGRVASQWHTRTRSGLVRELNSQDPEPYIELHPDEAARHDIADGDWVRLIGRRGQARSKVRISKDIRPGMLFMPFHWGEAFDPLTNVNHLTNPAADQISQQPELKFCTVKLVREEQQELEREKLQEVAI